MSMLTDIEAKKIMQQLIKSAVPFTFKTYSKKQFVNDFNSDGVINTPVGEIQLAEEQIEKLFSKNRMGFYGLIKPTLTNPLLVLPTWDKNNVQATTFIKTFFNKSNNVIYFASFSRNKKNILTVVSNHTRREEEILNFIKKGYKNKSYQEGNVTSLRGINSAKKSKPLLVFVHIGVPFSNTNVVNKNKMKNLNFINASTDVLTHKEAQELGILNNDGLGFIKPESAFKDINNKLLEELKKGNLIFRQPWKNGVVIKTKTYGPQNYETQRPYTGGNAFYISITNLLNKTNYNFFLTKKQIQNRGFKLKEKAISFPVSAFIINKKIETVKDKEGNENEVEYTEKGVIWYNVYPIEAIENFEPIKRKPKNEDTFKEEVIVDAEIIIENMPKKPQIKHGGSSAFYTPSGDYVQMPVKKAFHKIQEYYSTLYHELVHSTGHKTRLNRDFSGRKGDKNYAFEELIAEIGAAYLCGVTNLDYYTLNNSAAYLKSWAKKLTIEINEDPSFLKRAVFKAAKAANYIISDTIQKHGKVAEEKSNTIITNSGKTIAPNKNIKASLEQAIIDLEPKNNEIKKAGKMAITMLFNAYKKDKFPKYGEGLQSKIFEKLETNGLAFRENKYGLKESDQYEITENGLELVKKIEARLQTLKAKKSGTDLFPELNGTNPDVGLSFIERFVLMDNKKISENELANFFTDLANAIKSKKITKQHPYSKTINNISDRLYSIYKTLNLKESVLIEIKDVKELKSLLEKEQNGLGFLPLVVSAVAGKIVEKAIEKKLSPKSLDGYDVDGYYFDSIPKAKNNILTDESNLKQSIIEIREHLINNRTKQRNDSTGWFIEINNESIRKWFSKPLGFIKLKAFTAINDIIKVGVLIKTEKANKKLNKREKVHQFWSIVQVDGKNYPFGFLVIEKEGKFIYNTTLIPVEKTIKPTGLAGFKFVENFPFIPKLKQSAINKTSKVKVQKKSTPKNNSLAGVLSTAQMAGFTYKEIALNPYYAKILGKPATNFDMCIHGEPGSGKTVFLLKLANYLAENFGKVVYVTTEEFGSATLTKKIKDFNINSKNLFFTDKLEKINPSDFAFMFVDSVNHSGLKLADYKEMRIKHPNTAVILILQTTKGGTYKGGKDWPHEVEICARLFKNEKGQRMIEITKDRYTDLRTVKI